jgi:hypothetical protein
VALLSDRRATDVAGRDIRGFLFLRTKWKRRVDAHRGSRSRVQRKRFVYRRIERATRQISNDDDVTGGLAGECNGP